MPSKQRVLDAMVKEYLDSLEEEGAAGVTLSGYRWIIQTATDALKEAGMESNPTQWTKKEVNYIRNVVFGHHRNGVRRRHVAVINTYLQWHGNHVIRAMNIRWPTDERAPTDHLPVHTALEVLDAAQGVERIVIHLETFLGLRRVEVLRLTEKSFKLGYVDVQGKGRGGGKWRQVPFHAHTLTELENYRQLREKEIAKARTKNPAVTVPSALLIYERGGNLYPYKKTAVDQMVQAVSQRTGVRFTNHTLRRTFGRMLWEAGIPLEAISMLMGHEDTKTTMLYLGIDLADMAKAMNVLSRFHEDQRRNGNLFNNNILVRSGQSGI